MLNWFELALIPPALFAAINYLDKFIIDRYLKGRQTGPLVILVSLSSAVALPIIFVVNQSVFNIGFSSASLISINGGLFILGLIPFFYALSLDEVPYVAPLIQFSAIFSYFLGYFIFGETLTAWQILGSLLIVVGSLFLMSEFKLSSFRFKKKVFLLMVLASFLFAVNGVLFKVFAIQEGYTKTLFWNYIGFIMVGILLVIFIKSYRNQLDSVLSSNSKSIIGLSFLSEIINLIGISILNYALLFSPVALVYIVNDGFQPFFVLLYGLILGIFFPHILKENNSLPAIFQKILSISIMFAGSYLINV